MIRFKAIVFDLCGTLMQYRTDRIPLADINGEHVQSTTPLLYACFREFDRGKISYENFHNAFMVISNEIAMEKKKSGEEISSHERFERFLKKLDADLGPRHREIHRLLKEIHLDRVAKCLEILPRHHELLKTWEAEYPIGLVTNFDDVKTVRHVLKRDKIEHLFESVLISAEIGLRKPREELFVTACQALDTPPHEALFVGDNWEEDILGAKGIGMAAAWINPDRVPQPASIQKADYDLSDLSELQRIL